MGAIARLQFSEQNPGGGTIIGICTMFINIVTGVGEPFCGIEGPEFRPQGQPAERHHAQSAPLAVGHLENNIQDPLRLGMLLVPASFLAETSLCGDEGYVKERIDQYKAAGVTVLSVAPIAGDLAGQQAIISKLKELSA